MKEQITFSIHSYNSEGALKSKTPYAHEVNKARTLDLMIGNPDCNQGGVLVLQRRFSNVNFSITQTAPTIEAAAGGRGQCPDDPRLF